LSFSFLRPAIGLVSALICTFVKLIFPIIYFFFFFDGTFTALDDWNYLTKGFDLYDQYGFAASYDISLVPEIISYVGSFHYLNYVWNSVLLGIWGEHYYVPVFLNVVFTSMTTLYLFKLLNLSGFSVKMSRLMALYFCLHLSVISWSSFMNLRDPLVLLLTVLMFYLIRTLSIQLSSLVLISLLFVVTALLFTRSYIPFIVLVAEGCFMFFSSRISGIFKATIILETIFLFYFFGLRVFLSGLEHLHLGLSLVAGMFKFLITPVPWQISDSYNFLILDAIQHWALFPFMLLGALCGFMNQPKLRPLFVYAAFLILLYASVPAQTGVRYRFQLIFIIAPCQLYGLYIFFMSLRRFCSNHRMIKLNTVVEPQST
jgi:hypothetical protein